MLITVHMLVIHPCQNSFEITVHEINSLCKSEFPSCDSFDAIMSETAKHGKRFYFCTAIFVWTVHKWVKSR